LSNSTIWDRMFQGEKARPSFRAASKTSSAGTKWYARAVAEWPSESYNVGKLHRQDRARSHPYNKAHPRQFEVKAGGSCLH
jgi:hypothetical protein